MSLEGHPPIGQRIREERLRQGINLRNLARSVKLSASHISQIETGKTRPSVSTLYAITNVLGVSIDDIFENPSDGPGADAVPATEASAGTVPSAVSGDALPADADSAPGSAAQAGPGGDADTAGPTWRPPARLSQLGGQVVPGPSESSGQARPDSSAAALVALASEHERRIGPVVGPMERELLELDSGVIWERLGHVPGQHVDFLLITYAPGGSSSSTNQLMRHSGTEYGYLVSGELIVTLGFNEHKLTAGDAISFPSATPHRYRNEGTQPAVGVWFVANPDGSGSEGP